MATATAEIITYTEAFEILLKEEAEKAESMSILHHKSYQKYNKLSIITNIPVIILSAVVGFLSPIPIFTSQNIFLGGLSVTIGIIKTIDSYMDFTKRTQTHYLTSLSYKKIAKFIQIQLSLEKECRIAPNDLLNVITNDLENITNSEPCIPEDIILEFNKNYGLDPATKPPFCNGKLTNIRINKKETHDMEAQTDIEAPEDKHSEIAETVTEKKKVVKKIIK